MSLFSGESTYLSRNHAACCCASTPRFSPGSTARKYERARPFQITHLALDLDVHMKERAVSGTATLTIARRQKGASELSLDAAGHHISKVSLKAGASKKSLLAPLEMNSGWSHDGDTLTVELPQGHDTFLLEITYRAVPRLGLYFLSPDKQVPGRPEQVWSQCQDEDGRYWFPCQDKPHVKMSYEITARVPRGMTVLSGGELVSKRTPKSGSWEFHYRLDEPTPAYLMTLVVGKFEEWEESVTLPSGRKIPLRYLVPPGKKADGKRAFHRTAEAIKLFSERTGVEYPWARYSQVVVADFIFGGMENTTATTMYEHILVDEVAALDVESYDLVAHELAHQWFGDLVTCRDWSHAWLNEGFATYFEHVEREHRLGLDEYEHNVTADLNIYLGEARSNYKRPIVCRDYDEPIDLFDRHLYQKGGLVLHMLRRRLGEEDFWAGVKNYLNAHRGGLVETNDLMRALEETSGHSLEQFFDQWVYRPGHPDLKVKVSYERGTLVVEVEQTQKGPDVAVFELLFEVEIVVNGERSVHKRLLSEEKQSLVIKTKRPDTFTLDPNYLIAAPISLTAPADMLRELLRSGTRARARRMAAMALGRRQDPQSIEALVQCLNNKKELWMVRARAADSLAQVRGPEAEAALIAARASSDPKVRRAVATALGSLRSDTAERALTELSKDKSYLVSAAAARALGAYRTESSRRTLKGLLQKESWSEVIRAGALGGLAQAGGPGSLELLMEWSKYGKPLRARRAAIASLPKSGDGKAVREHLVEMLSDKDPHVRTAVIHALSSLGDPEASSAIEHLEGQELDGGVRTAAKLALLSLGKDGLSGVKEVREENQKLRRDLSDVKYRLAKLEQLATEGEKRPGAEGAARRKRAALRVTSKTTLPISRRKTTKKPK